MIVLHEWAAISKFAIVLYILSIITFCFAIACLLSKIKKLYIVGIISFCLCIFWTWKGSNLPRDLKKKVYLEDVSYEELLETYDVLNTEGLILTVQKKDELTKDIDIFEDVTESEKNYYSE